MNTENVIRSIRVKRNLSQEQLADKMGLSRQGYHLIENDIINRDISMLFKLMNILEVSSLEKEELFNAIKLDFEASYEK